VQEHDIFIELIFDVTRNIGSEKDAEHYVQRIKNLEYDYVDVFFTYNLSFTERFFEKKIWDFISKTVHVTNL
jgi:hypothetical protein